MKLNKTREMLVKMYLDALNEEELPWNRGYAILKNQNPITHTQYRGVNNALLSCISIVREYKDPRWLTFNQIKANDWTLEKGKGQGVPIEFWSPYDTLTKKKISQFEYKKILETDPERSKDIKPIVNTYYVFNASLIKGIPEYKLDNENIITVSPFIENLIKNMEVSYSEYGNHAFYNPISDEVVIPQSFQFKEQYAYDAVRLHELCHATGHESRLKRDIENKFGSIDYAKEELRAEISSSFICQELNLEISQDNLNNHKAYIQSWIKVLNDDPQELFRAIKDADKIYDYIIKTGELDKFKIEQDLITEDNDVTDLAQEIANNQLTSEISIDV